MVTYTYDAWGNPLSVTGSMASTLGAANPLRYRGYVYDSETGLYYVSSRYYDPEICRFINADGYASTGQGLLGGNAFGEYVDLRRRKNSGTALLIVPMNWNQAIGWLPSIALQNEKGRFTNEHKTN
ncbi:MAG: hypothetical protein IKO00_09315 [Oscillospiraceae bacterium]|nr:hypothetical protein [Oscillospiraceae bacterium]